MRSLFRRTETWVMFALGFSAGLPILLVYSTLSTWLHEAGVNLKVIGWFSLVGLAYGFKFLWAPLIDRIPCPILSRRLGHRRGWLLASQLALVGCLMTMGLLTPASSEPQTPISTSFIIGGLMIAIASATQDIVIDAVRVELAEPSMQAWLSGVYVAGYRVGMIIAGAGALYLASSLGSTTEQYSLSAWQRTYQFMALCMVVGIGTTFLTREPPYAVEPSPQPVSAHLFVVGVFAMSLACFFFAYTSFLADWSNTFVELLKGQQDSDFKKAFIDLLGGTARFVAGLALSLLFGVGLVRLTPSPQPLMRKAFVEPFADLLRRFGKVSLVIILVIGSYRLTDILMGVLANPFYLQLGFTKGDIATVTKVFGLAVTIFGGFVGGWLTERHGIYLGLIVGGALSAFTNIAFSWLAGIGNELYGLYLVIGIDNLAAGMAASAFVAFLSALTNREFTATQYASLFALTAIFPKVIAAKSGEWVEQLGYETFFILTAILGLPTLIFIVLLHRLRPELLDNEHG